MKIIRQLLTIGTFVTAVASFALAGTGMALADTSNVYLTETEYTWTTATGACVGYVMSASGDVTLFLENFQSGNRCTGWLEQSGDGSRWHLLSHPETVPSVSGAYSWTKTLNYPLGSGHAVRACLSLGVGEAGQCSPAASPAAGHGTVAQESYPVMYTTGLTSQASTVGACGAALSATTLVKSRARVNAVMYNLAAGETCTGWLEESADGGTTWRTVSEYHVLPSVVGEANAFTSLQPDGPGLLARACVELASSGSKQCTAAW